MKYLFTGIIHLILVISAFAQIPSSTLDKAGIAKADLILEINYPAIPDTFDFERIDDQTAVNKLGQLLFHSELIGVKSKKKIGLKTYSCASCHIIEKAGYSGIRLGIGEGGVGYFSRRKQRNDYFFDEIDIQIGAKTPPILNSSYATKTLWDGRLKGNLHQAVVGQDVHRLDVSACRDFPEVKKLMDCGFGTEEITAQRAAYAIACYEATVIANESKFQYFLTGELEDSDFSDAERKGMRLFFRDKNCADCHSGPSLGNEKIIDGRKVPGLYNFQDAGFYGKESKTSIASQFINSHQKAYISWREMWQLKAFLATIRDENLGRYIDSKTYENDCDGDNN